MKLLILLFGYLSFYDSPQQLLILDQKLKKPIRTATDFNAVQFMQNNFPVYAADVNDVIRATDKTVKYLDKIKTCFTCDTITAARTMFIIKTDCLEGIENITVMVVTAMEESKSSFGFSISARETNKRKAQQNLLNFAAYLQE